MRVVLGACQDVAHALVEQGSLAAHAFHEGVHVIEMLLDMAGPAAAAEPMLADINNEFILAHADPALALGIQLLGLVGAEEPLGVSNNAPILAHILEVVAQGVGLPLELPQQQQTPAER